MSRFVKACPDIKIPNGAADSNIVRSTQVYDDSFAITLFAPAALDAGTYTIQVAADPDNPVFVTLNDGTADINAPAAGKAQVYVSPVWRCFKIHSSVNVTADRIFKMNAEEFITE